MFRMNGIARCHGWQGAYMPREGLYLGFVWNKNQDMFRKGCIGRCHGQFYAPAKTAFPPSVAVMPWSVYVQEREAQGKL